MSAWRFNRSESLAHASHAPGAHRPTATEINAGETSQATFQPKPRAQSVRNRRDATRADGTRRSVQRHAALATREIESKDFFHVSNELSFPRMGSKTPPETPPHASGDFKWKDYCPMVFHKLREVFGIDQGEYVRSLCGDQVSCRRSAPFASLKPDARQEGRLSRRAELPRPYRSL